MTNRTKVYASWNLSIESEYPINFYVDTHCFEAKFGELNVAYILEPEEVVYKGFYRDFISIADRFEYVLTDKEEILESCANSIFFEFGCGWISKNPFPEKVFGISTVIGHKTSAEGHRMRHDLWKHRNEIKNPTYFYGSCMGGPPLEEGHDLIMKDGEDRLLLYQYQFQIVIENIRTNYWFTEKLIDCLVSKCVPIYYGAERIGDFFDSRGIISGKNSAEIIHACNSIHDKTYEYMLPYIEENSILARKYLDHPKRISDKLAELFP
jgi:hypothetical protein